jgi:hypothetical protein
VQTIQLGLGRSRRLGLASFLACLPPVLRRIMNYWLGLSLIDLLELGIATSEVVDAGVRRGAGRRSVQFLAAAKTPRHTNKDQTSVRPRLVARRLVLVSARGRRLQLRSLHSTPSEKVMAVSHPSISATNGPGIWTLLRVLGDTST